MAENSKRKRIIIGLVAGLVVVVVLIVALRGQAPVVPVVDVAREDLNAAVTSNGKVEPISAFVARAEFPAFVDKVMAVEGQAVRRGEVVLTLNAADIRSQLAQARADLLTAQTDLRNARAGGPPDQVAQLDGDLQAAQVQVKNLEDTEQALEKLVAQQASTPEELAQSQASLAKARANLQALQARKQDLTQSSSVHVEGASLRVSQAQELVKSLEEKVRSATVISPTDGTLYSLPVKAGDYVKVGDTLAEMADLRHVQVRAFVDEPDLGSLEPNQDVQVTWDAKPGKVWSGRTEQVPKQVVARGMRSVGELLCSINNDRLDLLPNINVQVRIMVRQRHLALVVPRAAVKTEKGQHFVFVFGDNKIHRRDIAVGVASASKYEVLSGLGAEDRVALPGDQELHDGMEVRAGETN
ncbi:MAG TPA: efflux RND transporter periplasmic adaptor subunit [Candidatus Acidoferrales bacterium]|nr:efflux RND transporter periplasmic adaptor subunit [Candidatus Acidoferrales bacterium]